MRKVALESHYILNASKFDLNRINEKYEISKTISKINNLVGWMIDAIKKDYQLPKNKVKIGTFNNFEQREYGSCTLDDLERN